MALQPVSCGHHWQAAVRIINKISRDDGGKAAGRKANRGECQNPAITDQSGPCFSKRAAAINSSSLWPAGRANQMSAECWLPASIPPRWMMIVDSSLKTEASRKNSSREMIPSSCNLNFSVAVSPEYQCKDKRNCPESLTSCAIKPRISSRKPALDEPALDWVSMAR